VVAAEMEEVVDRVVGGEEPLRLSGRLEPLHLPLSSSRRLMGVLRPVVETLVPAVLDPGYQLPLRRAVAAELVPAMVATQSRFSFEVKLPIQWRRGRLRA
jgi:hypothetical protein